MTYDPQRPYNELPDLPPPIDLETPAVLKATIEASRVLAELKGAGAVLPDQAILVNSLVLQEARVSSEIENIVTTNDDLFRAAELTDASEPTDPHTKEVLRYREALWRGFDLLEKKPFSTGLFVQLVQTIRGTEEGIRRVPGTRIASSSGEIVYTPPEGEELIREKLANLERFLHDGASPDPLVRMAVAHYQFEAIHPFTDGNGRTGRILNILYLVDQGLLDLPVLYMSHAILRTKDRYYSGLRRVTSEATEGAWHDWVLYLLDVVRLTAEETRTRILTIRDLLEETNERVKAELPKIHSKELVELLFAHPYAKSRFLENAGIAKRQTAAKYLKALEGIGVLESQKAGREMYYVNRELVGVLVG